MNFIDLTIIAQPKNLGGFSVSRILPSAQRQMVGPFIFLDHLGPATFATDEGINVRPHPHIGLATVTYLFQGEVLHRDSIGSEQIITRGAVNWMIAGRGVVHSERTSPEEKSKLHHAHGLQSWIALPIDGALRIGETTIAPKTVIAFEQGKTIILEALRTAHLMLLGGEPLSEPRFIEWNFVSSSSERIAQAKADWKAGVFGKVPGDENEFIPLPE